MATSSLHGFDGMSEEFPPDIDDLDSAHPPIGMPASQDDLGVVGSDVEEPQFEITEEVEPKDLLDVRGFFVSAGAGIYDGAQRNGEEPRDSYFADVQDYETGLIHRVWGVVLGEVMSQATAQYGLQPGSRVHLTQQGKQVVFTDSVENGEIKVRRTYANAWVCMPDRGPLPSQLAHLMSGINVDQMLDRIGLRHDMGLDDPRLSGWKREQKRILQAFGDDPQTIKGWLARQLSLNADEERKLVTAAVELSGYTEADPKRRQHEIDSRLAAIREMSADVRYDFLMEGAKPHLIAKNREKEEGLRTEVVEAIEQVAVMATAADQPDSPRRKAMHSALAQSLEGLSLTQQLDYIAQRREQVLQGHFAAAACVVEPVSAPRVSLGTVIDAKGLAAEEYQLLLEERLALANTQEGRAAIMAEEIEARKLDAKAAKVDFEAIDRLYQRFAGERDPNVLGFIAGEAVIALGRLVCNNVMPRVATTFEALGGLGSWRKKGCISGLDEVRAAFNGAKQSSVYRAFENDPSVVSACAGASPGEMLARHPDFSRTEVVMGHLDAQEGGGSPAPSPSRDEARPKKKGLWAGVTGAMTDLTDKVSHMSPENFLKGGKLDTEWVQSMRSGLQEFGQDLKETLMPEKLKAQIEEMIASIMAMIKAMMELARSLVADNRQKAPEASAATAMEP